MPRPWRAFGKPVDVFTKSRRHVLLLARAHFPHPSAAPFRYHLQVTCIRADLNNRAMSCRRTIVRLLMSDLMTISTSRAPSMTSARFITRSPQVAPSKSNHRADRNARAPNDNAPPPRGIHAYLGNRYCAASSHKRLFRFPAHQFQSVWSSSFPIARNRLSKPGR